MGARVLNEHKLLELDAQSVEEHMIAVEIAIGLDWALEDLLKVISHLTIKVEVFLSIFVLSAQIP